jgi:hypothetical protein
MMHVLDISVPLQQEIENFNLPHDTTWNDTASTFLSPNEDADSDFFVWGSEINNYRGLTKENLDLLQVPGTSEPPQNDIVIWRDVIIGEDQYEEDKRFWTTASTKTESTVRSHQGKDKMQAIDMSENDLNLPRRRVNEFADSPDDANKERELRNQNRHHPRRERKKVDDTEKLRRNLREPVDIQETEDKKDSVEAQEQSQPQLDETQGRQPEVFSATSKEVSTGGHKTRRRYRNGENVSSLETELEPYPRSRHSRSSINNPKLLETVEDAIRRLILPEL